jgi:ribonucleoside-diphosphate reductase alpha chain
MFVIKRDGTKQPVLYDKITSRIRKLCYGLNPEYIDAAIIAQHVISGLYPGITTSALDTLAAETCAARIATHPDYGILAARIQASNLQKETPKRFSEVAKLLHDYVEPNTNLPAPLLSEEVYNFIRTNAEALDAMVVYDRDFDLDYFGLRTLCRSYLLKLGGVIIERPQHMFIRVACGLHYDDTSLDGTKEIYDLLSLRYCIFGSPTLFNAGLPRAQLSSCFLSTIKDDSIDGIFDTLKDSANISKAAGGQSIAIHKIRAMGSYIRSTNGTSNGIIPMLRVFQAAAQYVDQGGGKRKGSTAIYLEPWHADIEAFLDLRKNTGAEDLRCRHLFSALWTPDLFLRRVEQDGMWSLFCPNEAPGLADCWGEKFDQLYEHYEKEKSHLIRKQLPARVLWNKILDSLMETGTPYFLLKDECNAKSNQQHLGTIQCSNLCAEIVQFTSPTETAVCNLGSIALNRFFNATDKSFDFQQLYRVTKIMVRNLNKVIDHGWLPTAEARYSNQRSRAIGLGVQALYDLFMEMRFPFDSKAAGRLNIDIFETMYFAACEASCELAIEHGSPYETFKGSPLSQGKFQFDLWGVKPTSNRYDWNQLREKIMTHGTRNSLLLALMPTASTSQILGNYESFEPASSLLYVRRTLAAEFVVLSKYLVRDLLELKLWNTEMKNRLIAHRGSVQAMMDLPLELRELHKTVWDIKQKAIIDMSADRAQYICQTQSLNIHMTDITHAKLTSLLFYAWKKKLKTCIYYLRSKAAVEAVPVTVEPALVQEAALSKRAYDRWKASGEGAVDATFTKTAHTTKHIRPEEKEIEGESIKRVRHEKDNTNTFETRSTSSESQPNPTKRIRQEEKEGEGEMENDITRIKRVRPSASFEEACSTTSEQPTANNETVETEITTCSLKNKGECVSCGG